MVLASSWFKDDQVFKNAAQNSPPMKKGDVGYSVRILQQALIELGFALPVSTEKYGSPDGDYGSETKAAVELFQKTNGLAGEADGRVGKNTLAKLDKRMVTLGKPRPNLPPLGGTSPGGNPPSGGGGPVVLSPLAAQVVAILREPALNMINFRYQYLWFSGSSLNKVADLVAQGRIKVAHDPKLKGWAEYVMYNKAIEGNQFNLSFNNPQGSPFYRSNVIHEAVHAYQDMQGFTLQKYVSEGLAYAVQAWYYMGQMHHSAPPPELFMDTLARNIYQAAAAEIDEARAAKQPIVALFGHKITEALKLVPDYSDPEKMREYIPYDGVP